MTQYNLVHKFVPMPQAMTIPDAMAAVDKEWKKLETISAWNLENVKSKKEVILEAQRDKKESPLCHIDKHISPQKCKIGTKLQKYKGRVVLREDIVKDDSGAYAVFTEQGLLGCDGQAADAVSA